MLHSIESMWQELNTDLGTLLRRALNGEERLWKVWWLWAIPVGLATRALAVLAEMLRNADWNSTGASLDMLKLLVYLMWFSAAWRCSGNVVNRIWTGLARMAIVLALGLVMLTV